MHTSSKSFDCFREVCCLGQRDERLFNPQIFGIADWDRLALLCLLGKALEENAAFFVGLKLAGGEEKILGQISIVESRDSCFIR